MLDRGSRIVITGGTGFLGQVVQRMLRVHGYGALFIPTIEEFDLRKETDIRRMYTEMRTRRGDPSGCGRGWDRREPGEPRSFFL